MKKYLIGTALAVACASLLSCDKNDTKPSGTEPTEEVVFSAVTEGSATRTELSDNGDDTYTVLWTAGDAINLNGYDLSLQTAAQPAGYGPGYTQGNFSGPWAPTAHGTSPKYKVLYPASIFGTPGSLPTEQTYVANNIAGFPMYAESDTKSFEFHNLCGIIRLGLRGDTRNISSIALVDIDDTPKPLSGPYTISSNTAVISSGTGFFSQDARTPDALPNTR